MGGRDKIVLNQSISLLITRKLLEQFCISDSSVHYISSSLIGAIRGAQAPAPAPAPLNDDLTMTSVSVDRPQVGPREVPGEERAAGRVGHLDHGV